MNIRSNHQKKVAQSSTDVIEASLRVDAQEFDTFAEFVDYYDGAGCEYFYVWDGQDWIVNDHSAKDANGFPVFDFVEVVQLKEIVA